MEGRRLEGAASLTVLGMLHASQNEWKRHRTKYITVTLQYAEREKSSRKERLHMSLDFLEPHLQLKEPPVLRERELKPRLP